VRGHCLAIAGLALVLCGPGCATTQVSGQQPSSPIEQATLTVGDRPYQIDACTSGDLLQFLGVDLADQKAGAFARVVIDPIDGPRLKVVVRGLEDGSAVFTRNQCSQLDADVQPTGWVVNNVRAVSGFVNAECRAPSGRPVSLHVRFTHCH
jgi:hypothetical protein